MSLEKPKIQNIELFAGSWSLRGPSFGLGVAFLSNRMPSRKLDAEFCRNGADSFFIYGSEPLAADAQANPAVFFWYKEFFIVQVR